MTDSAEIPAKQTSDPTNSEIAAALDELGDLYELDGAIIHRIVAYRNAAKAVRDASVSITALAREGRATELPGIGATIQEKLIALVENGEIPGAGQAAREVPAGAGRDDAPPGPRAQARAAAVRGARDRLAGGAADRRPGAEDPRRSRASGRRPRRASSPALDAVGAGRARRPRFVLDRALAIGDPIVDALREHPAAERVELAGSARRMTDSVKDLDVIATAHDPVALARGVRGARRWSRRRRHRRRGRRAACEPTRGSRSTCGSSRPTSSATCCSTSPAPSSTTWRCATPPCARACTSPSTGCSTTATGETQRCATEEEVYALLG